MNENILYSLTLCPQCNNNPFLFLNKDNPENIQIQCNQCGYNHLTSLHNYLHQVKQIPQKMNYNNNKCDTHKQPLNQYCTTCNLYLCNECNSHQSHKLVSLDNIY